MNAPTTVNLAIQFLPLRHSQEMAYTIIDAAIQVVQQSGLPYTVGPFETTIEGSYEQVMNLLVQMQAAAQDAGADELLINLKLHRNFYHDLHITDKTGTYSAA
jgi:uncharacterized protein YqgV (UPF0045/DUF77 family)